MANDRELLQNLEEQHLRLRRDLVRSEAALSAARKEMGVSPAPASSSAASAPASQPSKPLWGRMVSGARQIVRWSVIAVVAYMALNFATGVFGLPIDPSLSSMIDGVSKGAASAMEWIGGLFSGSTAAIATPAAAVAGVTGAAVIAKTHMANQHSTVLMPGSSPVETAALMPEELATQAGNQLAANYNATHGAAHHTAHVSHTLQKAAHVAADHTMDRMKEGQETAVQRALAARQKAHSWAEYVEQSTQRGPRGVA